MLADVAVRGATVKDGPAIVRLVRSAIRISGAGWYPASNLELWASSWGAQGLDAMIREEDCLVAVVAHDPVGFLALRRSEVDQLFVRPDYGGQGVARLLYRSIEEVARSRAVERLSAVASLRSAPVFASFGFEVVRRTERVFKGASFEVVHMAKDL